LAEFIKEFELKRLANEKVIGLWVGVQSLIVWKSAAAFLETLKILRRFRFYIAYWILFIDNGGDRFRRNMRRVKLHAEVQDLVNHLEKP